MNEQWILYRTTNLVNGKIYIGVHKLANTKRSRNYLGSGLALQPAIEKYGKENFIRTTLAEFSCGADAYKAEEQIVTEEFIKREDTYNLKIGGMGCKGLTHSEETKAKLSAIHKGRVFSAETRAKLSASGKGKIISAKQKAQIGAAAKGNTYNLGRVFSAEARERMSASQKGKIIKPETKAKISAFQTGRVRSPETRAKMSAARKGTNNRIGHKASEETKAKLSALAKGRTHSDETKAKLREYVNEERKAKMRENCGMAVVIHGKYYPSASFATSAVDASTATILSRARSGKPKFADYRFATLEEKVAHSLEVSRQST